MPPPITKLTGEEVSTLRRINRDYHDGAKLEGRDFVDRNGKRIPANVKCVVYGEYEGILLGVNDAGMPVVGFRDPDIGSIGICHCDPGNVTRFEEE